VAFCPPEKMARCQKSRFSGYDVSSIHCAVSAVRGGQHACAIADALGMKRVFVHPYGCVVGYGMGFRLMCYSRKRAIGATIKMQNFISWTVFVRIGG